MLGASVDGVVTARVVRLEQHPDAAKVQRVYVDAGDGVERHVWCGAFNMQPDDIVPLATLGTTMPDGRTIERRGILGIDSEGMLCSSRELGLGDDHSGIAILPAGTPLGVPYGDALGLRPDVLIDADVTRNRPDCWGYVGIARDLAAKLGVEFRPPAAAPWAAGDDRPIGVEIVDGTSCGRFTATVMSGIAVTSSPDWMARRLTAAGMRPINNVVDVSNYVMLELDQPNHAYDLDHPGAAASASAPRTRASGSPRSTVRSASSPAPTCWSATARIVRSAGSPVSWADSTPRSATTPASSRSRWRGSSRSGSVGPSPRHGLRSEASARFERGVDPYGMPTGDRPLRRTARRDLSRADGARRRRRRPRRSTARAERRSADVRISEVNRILGTDLVADDLPPLLDPIGYTVTGTGDVRTVALPTWRLDSTAEVDVIEEVARHYGYERLGKTVPKSVVHGGLSVRQQRRRLAREVLLGLGISEAMPNPFLGPDTLERAGLSGSMRSA